MPEAIEGLLAAFRRLPATRRILEGLSSGRGARAGGLWGSSRSLLAAAGLGHRKGPAVVLAAEDEAAERLVEDLGLFLPGRPALLLPTQDRDREGRPEPVSLRRRLRCLEAVRDAGEAFLAVVPLAALLDPVPSSRAMGTGRLLLVRGARHKAEGILQSALDAGLARSAVVSFPGEVSQRGDILDLWPLGAEEPLRLEFLDEELESLRAFDPETQRSLRVLEEAEVPLYRGGPGGEQGEVVAHLDREDLLVVEIEPVRLAEQATRLEPPEGTGVLARALRALRARTVLSIGALPAGGTDFRVLAAGSGPSAAFQEPYARARALLGPEGGRCLVVCRTAAEQERFQSLLASRSEGSAASGTGAPCSVEAVEGRLDQGFRLPELGATLATHAEFTGTHAVRRPVPRESGAPARAVASFLELEPGDLVVHAVHGVARYGGLTRLDRGGGEEDHLKLRFRDGVLLLVPTSKIDLVQKFVGAGAARPALDRLGGKGFARRKEAVERALVDMAAELLELQAVRVRTQGVAFPPDDEDMALFERAFPHEETPDQLTAAREVKADMEAPRPMDRLLCGDVGFGKTEVAMRAAFKAAMAGRQTAVLVPTTVLAEQHARTFRERMADWPIRVEVLSRFRAPRRQRKVLEETAQGRVDILIGTHRLLSADVAFADLGLVIVDEEQRFGVAHKERLKRLRATVDVLTLTATPIPRTLHMALLGIRDISALATAPAGRQDVETVVCLREPGRVAEAIRYELRRGGQVFFLHNRVETITGAARWLRDLVPEATVVVGHGQMADGELEGVVRAFVEGRADVLCSTTIIEAGLDIPRANTMLIDNAGTFGLADLHQLRGRVGRRLHKAFCYLMVDPHAPPGEDALRRLKAVEELSRLGAGFAIAMKDLEIRGAGNLLGPQQSGHVAAVGYDMYCRLLRVAAARARNEPVARPEEEVDVVLGVKAYLPDAFAAEHALKLEILREMDRAMDAASFQEVRRSLADRFGRLPVPVENLLRLFLAKHLLLAEGVRAIQLHPPDRLVVRHSPARPPREGWTRRFAGARPMEPGRTELRLPADARAPQQALGLLLEALMGGEDGTTMAGPWRRPCGGRSRPSSSSSPSRSRAPAPRRPTGRAGR